MIKVYADNDKTLQYKFKEVSLTTGRRVATTTGDATAFLATEDTPDAETADAAFEVAMIHVGRGKWIAPWDATDLAVADMDEAFPVDAELGYGTGFIIAVHSSGIRIATPFQYYRVRPDDE